MNIQGNIVTLRAIEDADCDAINRWSNSPELWRWLGGWHFPYSNNNTRNWISNIDNNDQRNQVFAIDTVDKGVIGTANLVNIDWKNRNAFHGMMLGDVDTRGKGYALDTVMAIMRYAFDELGLQRLDGDLIAYNKSSLTFYIEKCGWELEGVKKNWFYRNGEFHDKIVVGITKIQYCLHCKKTKYWEKSTHINK